MRRIYFLIPDIGTAHKIVDELRSEGIEDRHIHILAKRDIPLGDLPEAGVTIKTDFIPAVERGAALGGIAGLLAGLIGLRFAGCRFNWDGLRENTRLKKYEQAIEQGELLLLLDIPKDQINTISNLIIKHHPEAEFEGMEPFLPPSF